MAYGGPTFARLAAHIVFVVVVVHCCFPLLLLQATWFNLCPVTIGLQAQGEVRVEDSRIRVHALSLNDVCCSYGMELERVRVAVSRAQRVGRCAAEGPAT